MAARHSTTTGAAIHAAAYLRCSSDEQTEASIPQQREAVTRYAADHGYVLVAEYVDEGISGDATERRTQFLRMRDDAATGRFSVVLCWDQDRFGRFDIIDAGKWIAPFRDAGVRLETVAQGKIDWNDLVGQLIYSVNQLAKAQYLRDLSRNVTRGMLAKAKEGKLNGHVAYGYARILVDAAGIERQRVARTEHAMRPRDWSSKLVVHEEEAAIVRWLFTTFATTDTSLRRLAHDLNARGVAGPSGGPWYAATIGRLLTNDAYVGRFVYGRRRAGKYHHARRDDVKPRPRAEIANGRATDRPNPRETWIVEDHAHPAIIDVDTFNRVQEKLERRKRASHPGYRTHTSKTGDALLFSGLLYCERCARKMYGERRYGREQYLCSTYHMHGRQNDAGCRCQKVDQRVLLDVVIRKLQSALMLDGNRRRLESELRRQLSSRSRSSGTDAARLRKLVAKLDKQIAAAADRLLTAPDDLVDVLAPRLRELKAQRERAALELSDAERTASPKDVEATVKRLVDKLWTLSDELTTASPDRLREVLRLFVERIDLRFRHEGSRRSWLDAGTITLRSSTNSPCVTHT